MAGKLKINILIFSIAVLLIAAVTGYMIWNKPHLNVRDADGIKVTAVDLYKIFTTDSANAKSTYLNKVVAVSGEVKQVSINQQKQQIIYLKTHNPDALINCTMEENADGIKAGDTTEVKGICSGYSGDMDLIPGDVILIRCYCSTLKK